MLTQRQLFFQHVGQTTDAPVGIEIEKAEGVYLYGPEGQKYIDLVSGVSVSNIGHCHPNVVKAVKEQAEKYMHLMVYGEYIQAPQVKLAKLLANNLPGEIDSVYFVNSGSEANEGALKLAKRFTGRSEIIACKNAYHGSTHGALSIMGDEFFKNAFRPLVPGCKFIDFNNATDLDKITDKTACVIVEPVQGEGGVRLPENNFLNKLRERCDKTGTILIFDEIQTGFGRTGNLFASDTYGVTPDIITMAKGMGGGMPIGAFAAQKSVMDSFQSNPPLGHITTFGGHPVSCAGSLASLETLLDENILDSVNKKGDLFISLLKDHPKVQIIRGTGLFYAVEVEDNDMVWRFIKKGVENGITTDPFLFCENAFRIAPPLTITEDEIKEACRIILKTLDEI